MERTKARALAGDRRQRVQEVACRERAKRSKRVTISTSPLASWSSAQLDAVGLRASGLLAVDFGATFGAELLELSVERLPVGADAGVSEVAILRASFDHIFAP
jgi:hypothetical protein